jgi:hypothetical protein
MGITEVIPVTVKSLMFPGAQGHAVFGSTS